MNKIQRKIRKVTNEIKLKKFFAINTTAVTYKQFRIIARAIVKEDWRRLKTNNRTRSLWKKTWKAADRYMFKKY